MVVLWLILAHVVHNQLLLELSFDPFNTLHIYYKLLKMCLKKFNAEKNAFNRIAGFCIQPLSEDYTL